MVLVREREYLSSRIVRGMEDGQNICTIPFKIITCMKLLFSNSLGIAVTAFRVFRINLH